MHAEHENTLGNLNSEVSSLRAEIGELKSQLEQKTRDGEMVAKEKIELSTRVEDLQRQLASAQAGSEDLVELEQKLKSVQEERDGLVTKGDSALAEIEALKAEAVVDKGRMDDLEHRSQELDGRVKHLEGELEIKIAEGATLGERLEAIKAGAARQAQELESKVVELGSRAEAAEAAEAKVEAAEEKLQAAEQQLHTSISRAKELEQVRYHGSHVADHFAEDS
jgi:chromosome segregation ATPase